MAYTALQTDDVSGDIAASATRALTFRSPPMIVNGPAASSDPTIRSFDCSFELFRRFVQHIVASNTSEAIEEGGGSRTSINWVALRDAVAHSDSIEQAIGRAVVIADRMSRGALKDHDMSVMPSSVSYDDPFFAFSVADAIPDFGDQSRYRTRVTSKVARFLGTRRTVAHHYQGPGLSTLDTHAHAASA